MGQGVLADAVAAASSLVAVAALATWLGSPASKYILPAGTKNNADASVRTSLLKGSVVLFSACKVAVPNAEGSGLTDGGRGRWRRLKCRHDPGLKMKTGIRSIYSKKVSTCQRLSRKLCHPLLQPVNNAKHTAHREGSGDPYWSGIRSDGG